jgi:hypothetical protein
MSMWADVPTKLLVTAKQVACWGHQAHRSVSCCMAGWQKIELFVLGSPSPLPRVMLHDRGIKIDLNCLGVTKPTTPCHVAWPGHKNRFKMFWGSPSPLPCVMLHGQGIKIDLKCFGGHQAHYPVSCCMAGA